MTLQNNFINLSSAVGLGLIDFDENDIAIDYGCMSFDSFVYASRLCRKIGHSSIEMTIRYAHPTTDGKVNAVKALERQMEDTDSRNIVATAKVTSMLIVVTNSDN